MQKQYMVLDIPMANKKWEKCESIIGNMDVVDDYKEGLQKSFISILLKEV